MQWWKRYTDPKPKSGLWRYASADMSKPLDVKPSLAIVCHECVYMLDGMDVTRWPVEIEQNRKCRFCGKGEKL